MLYDNALLAQVYLEAFTKTGKELYRAVAIETIDYLLRGMRSEEGGFYAAEDAGEVGREGEFYAGTLAAIEEVLGADRAREFSAQYGSRRRGILNCVSYPRISCAL
jgi:uncharacterized protein YyaL (SSP411 family)